MVLVALKVKIGLRPNGHADHPDWTVLPLTQAGTTRQEKEAVAASHMVVSWHYDKTSGHREGTPDSPHGMQWGMILVTEQFAAEAVATYPTLITKMTETEAQDFWENKAWAHVPENRADLDELQGLLAQRQLMAAVGRVPAQMAALDAEINRALDPNDPRPGVRKNAMKRWADAKALIGFEIKP